MPRNKSIFLEEVMDLGQTIIAIRAQYSEYLKFQKYFNLNYLLVGQAGTTMVNPLGNPLLHILLSPRRSN